MPKISINLNANNWKWLFFLGLLLVVLSFASLSQIVNVTILSILFIGIIFIIAGIIHVLDIFSSRVLEVSLWHTLSALLYLAIGGLIIYDPYLASSLITLLIGIAFTVIGIIRLVMTFLLRADVPGWSFLIINSVATIIMGLIIITFWPGSSLWVIGIIITIELMISGWTYIFLALIARHNNR